MPANRSSRRLCRCAFHDMGHIMGFHVFQYVVFEPFCGLQAPWTSCHGYFTHLPGKLWFEESRLAHPFYGCGDCHVLICYGEYGTRRASIIEYACGARMGGKRMVSIAKGLCTVQNFTMLFWQSPLPALEKQTSLQPGSILHSLPLQASLLHLKY